MPGDCLLPGVLCRQRSGRQPLPRPLLAPLPIELRPLRSSARRTHRYAEPEPGQEVRGGVNTCRARTRNTCEAVSTPPRLRTAHLHRTSNFYSPLPSRGGRAEAAGAGAQLPLPGAERHPRTARSRPRGVTHRSARPVLNQPTWAEGGRSKRGEERK